jgi:NAD(P)-dependent dehydrogenase (short-subunit alcohol dehydrogenase family)
VAGGNDPPCELDGAALVPIVQRAAGDPAAGQHVAGRVALVTGASRGLGREVAVRLAEAGAAVAIAARSADELAATARTITTAGGRALPFVVDVTDGGAVREVVDAVERKLGPVDLLVANAGVVAPLGPAWEIDAEEWWRALEINVRGVFLCAHAVLGAMTARRSGRVITLASGAGLQAWPFGSAYCTSKAAVIRLAEALAVEAEPYGVSVFALDPGWVTTAMTDYLLDSDAGRRWTPGCGQPDRKPHTRRRRAGRRPGAPVGVGSRRLPQWSLPERAGRPRRPGERL